MREMALLNSIEGGGETSGMKSTLVPGRGRPLAPIIRVGIPPPGAIILNGAQAAVAPVRGRGMRPLFCNITFFLSVLSGTHRCSIHDSIW